MKLAYIDSCVYIARFEGIPAYKTLITTRLDNLAQDGWVACISKLVVLETLFKPSKAAQHALVQQYSQLFGVLKMLNNYPELFEDTQRIMHTEDLRVIDALHVAIALHHNCQLFVSSDPHFRSLQVIPPYWIDLREVLLPDTSYQENAQ